MEINGKLLLIFLPNKIWKITSLHAWLKEHNKKQKISTKDVYISFTFFYNINMCKLKVSFFESAKFYQVRYFPF